MSADNWTICPKCLHEAETALLKLQRRVVDGYGTLPLDEFDALRVESEKGIDHENLRTFREDYEFYGAEEGEIQVAYSGHCSKCGCGIDFKDSRGFYSRDPL